MAAIIAALLPESIWVECHRFVVFAMLIARRFWEEKGPRGRVCETRKNGCYLEFQAEKLRNMSG